MRKRPTSITVIAWFLIVSLGFSLLVVTAMINNAMVRESMNKSPIPIPVHYAIIYIGGLLTLSSGVAMLKQHNWARYLYVIAASGGVVFVIITSPTIQAMIPSIAIFIGFTFFLFRPKANEYFSNPEPTSDAQGL